MTEILIVLTSHGKLGDTGKKTGFWLEELAAPYYVFKDAGAKVTLASPQGGRPPLDPKSEEPDAQTDATRRFDADDDAQRALAETVRLKALSAADFDAVFYPGGHGPLWDLVDDPSSIRLIEAFRASGKPVAAVCHAPAVLIHAKDDDGRYLVDGRRVTGFSNAEEKAVGLLDVVPLRLEDALIERGASYSKGDDWQSYVCADGGLITGQNPASSEAAAKRLLAALANMGS